MTCRIALGGSETDLGDEGRLKPLRFPSYRAIAPLPRLTAFASVEEARLACRLPFPVVNLVSYIRGRELPSVTLDNREIGRLQAAHLLDRRFQRLVYYGVCDLWYSRERWAGFQAAARSAGAGAESAARDGSTGRHR